MRGMPESPWLRRFSGLLSPGFRLLCLPHAGGSASFFRDWRKHLEPDVELLAVQYPGREERYGEAPAASLEAMAACIAEACAGLDERPLALFGHSMGAAVAYEVALALQGRGRAPLHLFVSAHPPPHRQRGGSLHRQADAALLADVRRQSDGLPWALDEPAVRELFLPALRADYRLIERYRRERVEPLDCPVSLLLGEDDDEVNDDEALAWAAASRCGLDVRHFAGGHFYLRAQRRVVLDHLGGWLASYREPAWQLWP
ncbi:enantio-pyochelin biosynthetic protein PchC [Pseudomonas sp. ADP]|uniref:Enantio-pyochelin biosynthetic protein PchC n=2 Tax=Pseudomonas TaxID=286 RepID=A0A1A9KCA5_9PSED|nr:enantio-pyochelin biosynthetic protein PchC [Pseudomonas citronellolis]KSW27900.1 enantio-pyochelin biosynthetic protein PchC [Pseudomonas sp. ADP]OBP07470.1 enantio-pyochelin biosynthetic protein PchC [Pseudomonas sp. EGD-AKN5]